MHSDDTYNPSSPSPPDNFAFQNPTDLSSPSESDVGEEINQDSIVEPMPTMSDRNPLFALPLDNARIKEIEDSSEKLADEQNMD